MSKLPCHNRPPFAGQWVPTGRWVAVAGGRKKPVWRYHRHRMSHECMAWYPPDPRKQECEPLRQGWAHKCVGCRWLPEWAKELA